MRIACLNLGCSALKGSSQSKSPPVSRHMSLAARSYSYHLVTASQVKTWKLHSCITEQNHISSVWEGRRQQQKQCSIVLHVKGASDTCWWLPGKNQWLSHTLTCPLPDAFNYELEHERGIWIGGLLYTWLSSHAIWRLCFYRHLLLQRGLGKSSCVYLSNTQKSRITLVYPSAFRAGE